MLCYDWLYLWFSVTLGLSLTVNFWHDIVIQLILFYEQNNIQIVYVFLYCLDPGNGSSKLPKTCIFNNRHVVLSRKTLIGESLAIDNAVQPLI
jgi:hypothetical protein